MTTLELEIQKRGLTMYKFVQELGYLPQSSQDTWKKKVQGLKPMSWEDLAKVCEVLSKHGDPVTSENFPYTPQYVFMK